MGKCICAAAAVKLMILVLQHLLPAQRCGTEEDIVGTVLYALGRAGSYVNGGILVIDGGVIGQNAKTY